jgi:uncharacterized protein HemX
VPAIADQVDLGLAARQVEARDVHTRKGKRQQAVLSLLVAIVLGMGTGLYLHGCQQRAALAEPPSD